MFFAFPASEFRVSDVGVFHLRQHDKDKSRMPLTTTGNEVDIAKHRQLAASPCSVLMETVVRLRVAAVATGAVRPIECEHCFSPSKLGFLTTKNPDILPNPILVAVEQRVD